MAFLMLQLLAIPQRGEIDQPVVEFRERRWKRESYNQGGARGAMLKGTSVDATTWAGEKSRRRFAGARPSVGAEEAIAAPAVAQ